MEGDVKVVNTYKELAFNMPTASPKEMDGSFTVGRVAFDNQSGLGNTSRGGNVLYEGAVAWIRPTVFRRLATRSDRSDTFDKMLPLVERGQAIAAPFLVLRLPDFEQTQQLKAEDVQGIEPYVMSHEGRARSDVFKALNGDVPMPVQLFFHGFRARHLCEELFDAVEEGILNEAKTLRIPPRSTCYYWQGRLLRVKERP